MGYIYSYDQLIECIHEKINEEIITAFLKSNTLISLNMSISGLVQDNNGRDKIVMLQSNNI